MSGWFGAPPEVEAPALVHGGDAVLFQHRCRLFLEGRCMVPLLACQIISFTRSCCIGNARMAPPLQCLSRFSKIGDSKNLSWQLCTTGREYHEKMICCMQAGRPGTQKTLAVNDQAKVTVPGEWMYGTDQVERGDAAPHFCCHATHVWDQKCGMALKVKNGQINVELFNFSVQGSAIDTKQS